MWTTLSASRWICLLTLAVVMLFSAKEVDTFLDLSCCYTVDQMIKEPFAKCFEQKPMKGCLTHAYLMINTSNKRFCVKPTTQNREWLEKNGFDCPPVISQHRFEVLDEDDVE